MQSNNLAFVLRQATDKRQSSAFARAVRASIEVGTVVPSILRAKLAAAGFEVLSDEADVAEYGFRSSKLFQRVLVVRPGQGDVQPAIVAMGATDSVDNALLHAVLGWFRENAVEIEGEEVPEGLASVPQGG